MFGFTHNTLLAPMCFHIFVVRRILFRNRAVKFLKSFIVKSGSVLSDNWQAQHHGYIEQRRDIILKGKTKVLIGEFQKLRKVKNILLGEKLNFESIMS